MTNLGDSLITGLHEALAYERGELAAPTRVRVATVRQADVDAPPIFDRTHVRMIREKLHVSQPIFAAALGVSEQTVAAWEQGRRTPDGSARRLLELIDEHPAALLAKIHM